MMNKVETLKKMIGTPAFKKTIANRSKRFSLSLIRGILIIGLAFVIIYPILQMIVSAISSPDDLSNPRVVWIPLHLSAKNYHIASQILDYKEGLLNTFIMSTGVMILTLITTSLAGYSFARLRFKGSQLLFFGVIFTIVVPPQTIAMPLYMFFNNLKLTSTFYSIFLLSFFGMGIKSGLFIYIFRQVYRNLPKELEEAAIIDGCGVVATYFKVMLPNSKPAIITVALFSFVWQWNDVFYTRLLIAVQNLNLLSVNLTAISAKLVYILQNSGVEQQVAEGIAKNPLLVGTIANTAALMMMLPLLIGYIFIQRLFVESVERAGIVG